jgi:glyoxylase-like metal-dependent hydrolase (beta-lactamase superfamily II)
MKVNDDLYILKLPMAFGGVVREMNLSLIVDPSGLSLVDTGLPGQEALIAEAIEAEGLSFADLKRIIITHQDLDHIGSLHALKEQTGSTVLALDIEIPYIDGRKPLVKSPSPERLAANPDFARVWNSMKMTSVDQSLIDGEVLDIAGGVRIVATPGHSPGHASLYLERSKTLITGDAMVSADGELSGPSEGATPDMPTALESVKKLGKLDVETIVCYHGGLVTDGANGQLSRVANPA